MRLKTLPSFFISTNNKTDETRPPDLLTQKFHILTGGLLAFVIFWIDLLLPLGVAAGVPYLFLVLLAWWAPHKKFFYLAAFAGTVLTLLGLALSPSGGEMWKVLSNRCLALAVIWGTAFLGVAYKKQAEEIEKTTAQVKASEKQLRELCAHLESVREEERLRVAREIHDELGQVLTTLKLEISLLEEGLPKDSELEPEIFPSILSHIDGAIQTVKKVSGELRPFILDNLGILEAVEWEMRQFEKRTRIQCELHLDYDDSKLELDKAVTVFRIFQETLTNIVRHANASKVSLSLTQESGCLVLTIVDNGKGVSERQINAKDSFGLIGMRERAYVWGGEIFIKGTSGKGTEVVVHIPLENASAKPELG
ncbi:MAG: sensor histidine kinase [Nitrospina sp.]|nr:sensor histidine kinase [Nitrospina sp.]MBT3415586.1 sensor histidine kinase [Nitrospina sp.]MBT3855491.1 sensor histidine kinase [Nitrospina sp.]MBT4104923.1 sensor histidine kinase [Nitrospina sp.]MBT4388620.1 sensor histidine kinase [Nitrospina sp.]